MDEISKRLDDIQGLAAANALILGELIPIMHRMAPAEIDELVDILEAIASRTGAGRDEARLHISEAVRHLREKLPSRRATP